MGSTCVVMTDGTVEQRRYIRTPKMFAYLIACFAIRFDRVCPAHWDGRYLVERRFSFTKVGVLGNKEHTAFLILLRCRYTIHTCATMGVALFHKQIDQLLNQKRHSCWAILSVAYQTIMRSFVGFHFPYFSKVGSWTSLEPLC